MKEVYNSMEGPQKGLFKILLILLGTMLGMGIPYLLGTWMFPLVSKPGLGDPPPVVLLWLFGVLCLTAFAFVFLIIRLIYNTCTE